MNFSNKIATIHENFLQSGVGNSHLLNCTFVTQPSNTNKPNVLNELGYFAIHIPNLKRNSSIDLKKKNVNLIKPQQSR